MARELGGWVTGGLVAVTAAAVGLSCVGHLPSEPPVLEPPVLEPTVLMISLDGFRADYRALAQTPSLDRLAAGGVEAEGLVPAFPAETFPGHYTIVTGLYPERHGIVANSMWDEEFDAIYGVGHDREETFKSRWWGGEPLWVTAGEQGLVTASYFWVGTEAVIQDRQPEHWFPYDGSTPPEARVDQVLAWLDLPAPERPRFITMYLSEPNDSGHRHGPTAPEVLDVVADVDAVLGRLLHGLDERGLTEQLDIVIVSDHGMADVGPDRTILLEDYIDMGNVAFITSGAWLQIFPKPGHGEEIFAALSGAHPKLEVFRKKDVPARFHFREHRRIAPIVGVPENGWMVGTREVLRAVEDGSLKGAHGFDNEHREMWGVFLAHGPSFRSGARVERLFAVDVYQLVAAALEIEPAPNDGDPAVLARVLAAD